MKDLNYISQEITKGRNLEVNLKKYATGMASMYNGLAHIKLSMNYYTVYDMLKEREVKDEQFIKLFNEFNQVIGSDILGSAKTVDGIESIRNEIMKIMEVVTGYVDRLRIYEYVLNRVEHRFTGQEPDNDYYGMYLTNDIMHYILSDKDNVVINSKISEILGQLPMRLSRPKFYDYIRDAFSLYHGAQKGTIDDFAYALRTSAMIGESSEFETIFPEAYDIYKTLANADYAKLDEAGYNRLKDILAIGAEKMTDCADMFVLLAQMVNDAYTIILTSGDALDNVEEIDNALSIIRDVKSAIDNGYAEVPDELLERFTAFEGKQERILMIVSKCDYAIDMALLSSKNELKDNGCLEKYINLSNVLKLQSGSDFVQLISDESNGQVPDDSYADKVVEELISAMDEQLSAQSQMVRRAVMASVISQLPVFFNNTEEIQQYINLSLEQCNDAAERMAVIEVMKMIIQD